MLITILLPLIAACLVPALARMKQRIHTGLFVIWIPAAIFIYYARMIGGKFQVLNEHTRWIPSLGINLDFHLDGLSLLFTLLISGIGTLVVLYSIFYLSRNEQLGHFYVYLLMFMTAMLGVVLSDNVFVLYTFWELTSISSFLLIGYWHHREKSRYGALKSMLITIFGGLSMFGGLILLSVITGTTSIQGMIQNSAVILDSPYLPLVIGFILIGAFTKSAQFPFHIWLPDAMEAPTPVSSYLHSATMVKAGLYLVARFFPIFSQYEWFVLIVSLIGIITLCWGSYMAVRQTDLKAILAFSTISQLGMIMSMLGFGTKMAVFAALFHILNHATFKGSLFMIAGAVDHETGTRDIRKLGGLMAFMPYTAALALFGTFSMAGIPLPFLNGFYSKELFFETTLHNTADSGTFASWLFTAIPYLAVIGSIFTFAYSMYFFFGVFFGKYKPDAFEKKPHETPLGMLISPFILVLGIILIGLFPNSAVEGLLVHAAAAVSGESYKTAIHFWHGFKPAFIMSLIVVVVGTIIIASRNYWKGIYDILPGKWSLNKVYDRIVAGLNHYTEKLTNFYMTGSVKNYMLLILSATILGTIGTMVLTDGIHISQKGLAPVTIMELSIVLIMVVAAVATIFANNNLAAILILGVVGFGTSMLFIIYRAPDLALTQLVIETISMALFLLTFYHLPKLKKRDDLKRVKITNLIISIAFGAMLSLIGIISLSSESFGKISDYFINTSKTVGGGNNIVNVILVDMRGFDTLFEISVLGIAALAIYALVQFNRNKGER
ncbi:Na+/H+ antiporter subunit A [Aciduricibacillus chroicocephali]|uniref:Na+/H+ antiporter subunit A n=1 Tax=Aciduricibacillus chroicocephali TaxID=3054939 RepID=A0ABY9KV41_9BACI|nr:Na+/H+ antiporter subunit A [Bacillaceae bacterium 44XB]